MIVCKFGGAVLDGATGLRRVRDRVASLPRPLLLVVSAFADGTNRLESIAHHALEDHARAEAELHRFVDDHRRIASDVLGEAQLARWEEVVGPYISRLDEVVRGLSIVRELSARTLDLVVHFGERFSSALVHAALLQEGIAAEHVPATELIITDERHRYARPDIELTRERVEARLRPILDDPSRGVAVIEGYIARSLSGQATTMGRESSDYTATLVASLLGASEVRIFTGVPGILTADPAIVHDARTIPSLSYATARTLAELGAKVLHPRTVTPVERASIPLVITDMEGHATTIGTEADGGAGSVVFLKGAGVITMELDTPGSEIEPFLQQIAATSPAIWHHRFRRRLQVVTATNMRAAELPIEKIAESVMVEAAAASLVSFVREGGVGPEEIVCFFRALEGRTPLAVQVAADGRSISAAVAEGDGVELARKLHEAIT